MQQRQVARLLLIWWRRPRLIRSRRTALREENGPGGKFVIGLEPHLSHDAPVVLSGVQQAAKHYFTLRRTCGRPKAGLP